MKRRTIDRDLDRVLTRLRNAIREQGFTQLEVQEALGWGRSYISQLLTRQKTLRVEQVLMILNVISVKPEDFFGEIFQFGEAYGRPRKARRPARRSAGRWNPQEQSGGNFGADASRPWSALRNVEDANRSTGKDTESGQEQHERDHRLIPDAIISPSSALSRTGFAVRCAALRVLDSAEDGEQRAGYRVQGPDQTAS